jgi:hypothetical protein
LPEARTRGELIGFRRATKRCGLQVQTPDEFPGVPASSNSIGWFRKIRVQ